VITSTSLPDKYLARFSDGTHEALTDTVPEHGGQSAGFRPHDLLEAALASCICTIVRIAADKRGIPLAGVRVSVALNRENTEESVFITSIELEGDLSPEQRDTLLRSASACPVKKTLSKRIVFQAAQE
jgi:putative redox protein